MDILSYFVRYVELVSKACPQSFSYTPCKVKVKPLCLIKQQTMGQLKYNFALAAGMPPISPSATLHPRGEPRCAAAGLDALETGKISCPYRGIVPQTPSLSSIQ
jgi:hypothetical protein